VFVIVALSRQLTSVAAAAIPRKAVNTAISMARVAIAREVLKSALREAFRATIQVFRCDSATVQSLSSAQT